MQAWYKQIKTYDIILYAGIDRTINETYAVIESLLVWIDGVGCPEGENHPSKINPNVNLCLRPLCIQQYTPYEM